MIAAAHRPPFVLALLVALVGVVALADASPIDPTWVPGIYDEGDHDDVVLALISASGLPHGAALQAGRFLIVGAAVRLTATTSPPAHEFAPAPARAPPDPLSSP